ncbi:MAG TPA: hypothetical protein VND45_11230 [Thermoanaerobaculia bacterium]|jgi:hypothetical protein|nr:hypothetical protein [Thermoanaerobaculia bacterium]
MLKLLLSVLFAAPLLHAQTPAFERFLVPIYLEGETSGAFGSRWVSDLRILNTGPGYAQIENYGICGRTTAPCFPETFPANLSAPGDRVRGGVAGVPAVFLLVKPEHARQFVFQARVRDVARSDQSWAR